MYKKALTLLFLSCISVLTIQTRSVKAIQIDLTDGDNSAFYDDDYDTTGNLGFTDWQLDSQSLLTTTGLFYRIGNTGTAQVLDTLTETSSNVSGNSATATYTGTGFTIDLEFSLSDSGSTLNQIATVNNTSGGNLDFELYAYFDLITSEGNAGDTVEINNSNYSATKSGDRNTIVTTITESIIGSNTTLTERRAEVDAIDFINDTLLQKLQLLSDGNLELDNDLGAIIDSDYPVSFAYQWNYNLHNNESFSIAFNSNNSSAVGVPFEFSPTLGLLLSAIFSGGCYLKTKLKTPEN